MSKRQTILKWLVRLGALGALVLVIVLMSSGTPLATYGDPGEIILEADSGQLEIALGDGKPGILEFYTTTCPWCKKLEPELAKVNSQLGEKVFVYKMNAVKNTHEARKYQVEVVPTMVIFDFHGRVKDAVVGYKTHQEILEILKSHNLID